MGNIVKLNTVSLDGNTCIKRGSGGSGGGGSALLSTELALTHANAAKWETLAYYSTIEAAISDISRSSIASNCSADEAVVAVDFRGRYARIFLLKNTRVETSIDIGGIELLLGGNTLDVIKPLHASSDCVINGRAKGSTVKGQQLLVVEGGRCNLLGGTFTSSTSGLGVNDDPYASIQIAGGRLKTYGCNLIAADDAGGTISNIFVASNADLYAIDTKMTLTSKTGMQSCCVYNKGGIMLERCKLEAFSDHTANAAGNNYASTARAIYGDTDSITQMEDCYIYGAHSGATVKGTLNITRGTYCGYSHGGVYIATAGNPVFIRDAVFKQVPLPAGYYDDGRAGTNGAALYIGGATNIQVYVDNCVFDALIQPIVMKNSSNVLYISNSRMNKDYSRAGIRNDSSNQVKFGVRNNFDVNNLENKRNYENTDADYGS